MPLTGDPSALEDHLSLMECAIPLTRIPDLADLDGPEAAADLAEPSMNLFAESTDQPHGTSLNFLRQPRRSAAANRRIIALRRRQVRRQLRPALPQWPLAGGQDETELARMRACLYAADPAVEDRPSTPLRIATHAISLSLMATALPVGAAVMTYNLLKGEDMRVTARLTTLTGLALAVIAGNPELALIFGA